MEQEKEFPKGIRFDKPKEGAPDFVKGKIGIYAPDFIEYLQAKKNEKGWVNLDLKQSKGGKLYLDLDDWKPTGQSDTINPNEIPF